MFHVFAGIVSLSSLLSFLNKKWLKLPDTIGVMILAIITVIAIAVIGKAFPESFQPVLQLMGSIDFKTVLFDFLLAFLLFAGSIEVDVHSLLEEKGPVLVYATVGVLLSTFLIGTLLFYVSGWMGLTIEYLYCLVFGALISPTDPIAVLALLQQAGAPKDLEIKIVGESLFNDGVGIVVFVSLLGIATMHGGEGIETSDIALEFIREAFGGVVLGLFLGFIGKVMLRRIFQYPVISVHITLALVMGGYCVASALHVSGALAMVVLGLMIGNYLHTSCQHEPIKQYMTTFWSVLDDIFNAILFVMIGLEILVLEFRDTYLLLGLAAIVLVLLSRFVSVFLSNVFFKKQHRSNARNLTVLTWAGLRGGISIALALSIPEGPFREIILFITYSVVVFSIIVQGLTIDKLVIKLIKTNETHGIDKKDHMAQGAEQ